MVPMHRNCRNLKPPRFSASDIRGWRMLMKKNAWTQTALAKHLGLHVSQVTRWLAREAFDELPE